MTDLAELFGMLYADEFAVLRVRHLVSERMCHHLSQRVLQSNAMIDHADVMGLRVVGPSHFQAARDPLIAEEYRAQADRCQEQLRALAQPHSSPFDAILSFLRRTWRPGCDVLRLPTEGGALAPFTVRVFDSGVGILPHQDILSVESPGDPVALTVRQQFSGNLFLAVADAGGDLELFSTSDADYAEGRLHRLEHGARVISRAQLSAPALTVAPVVGDLIMFRSDRIHDVAPTKGPRRRVTVSFFLGVRDRSAPLAVWA